MKNLQVSMNCYIVTNMSLAVYTEQSYDEVFVFHNVPSFKYNK